MLFAILQLWMFFLFFSFFSLIKVAQRKYHAPTFPEKYVNVLFSIFPVGCALINEKEKNKTLAHLTNAPMFSDDIVYALFFSFLLILSESAGNGRHDRCVNCWIVFMFALFENEIEMKGGSERHDTR